MINRVFPEFIRRTLSKIKNIKRQAFRFILTPELLFIDTHRMRRSDKLKFINRRKYLISSSNTDLLDPFLPSSGIQPLIFKQGIAEIPLENNLKENIFREVETFSLSLNSEYQRNSKPYLQALSDITSYDPRSSVFRFATDPKLIAKIQLYFGSPPVLHEISYLESRGDLSRDFDGSQLWHRDGDDVTNLKVWFFLDDISDSDGPTCVIAPEESERIAESIDYIDRVKLKDTVMHRFDPRIVTLVGRAGEVKAFDSDRCFHMGSRVQSFSRRRVLMFHYVTRQCTFFWPTWLQGWTLKPYPFELDRDNSEYLRRLLYRR